MPCVQGGVDGFTSPPTGAVFSGPFRTKAGCNQACADGACCESGGICTVRQQCQCQGIGQFFKGVGTVCESEVCGCCGNAETLASRVITVTVTRTLNVEKDSRCACIAGQGFPIAPTQCESLSDTLFNAGTDACVRRVLSSRTGLVELKKTTAGCVLFFTVLWPLGHCFSQVRTIYWQWPYSQSLLQYTASYFVFLFVNSFGELKTVSATSSSVPAAPGGFSYAGAKFSIDLSVHIA